MKGLLFYLFSFSMCGVFGFAQTMAEMAGDINLPKAGKTMQVGDLNFGVLSMKPRGTVKALMAGEEVCGLVLSEGNYSFTISDKFSAEVAKRNIKSMERIKLSGAFDRAVVWTFDDLGAKAVDEGTPQELDWVYKLIRAAQFDLPALDLITAYEENIPGTVFALIHRVDPVGGKYYLYRRDPYKDVMEEVFVLDKISSNTGVKDLAGDLMPYRLVAQPINRQWWERFPAPLVAVYENISIDNEKDDHVIVKTTTKLQVMGDNASIWRVPLVNNVWSNRNFARMNNVRGVTVNGKPAEFIHQSHELIVNLGKPYAQGAIVTVVVENGGDIAIHPDGNQYWNLGTFAWYPQPELNGELAMLEMTVRSPKPLVPFASGNKVSLEDQGTHMVLKTQLKKPIQFPVAAAGKWKMYEKEQNGLKCTVGSYVIAREKGATRLMNNFFVAADYYKQLYGVPYPFQDLSILELNRWGMGQAPASVIFLSAEAFDTKGSLENQLFSQGVNGRFVHEVAHAWWGHVVKMDSIEEQWLTESFAEYSAAMFIQAARGKRGKAEFKKIVGHWRGNANKVAKGGSIYLANYLGFYRDLDYYDRQFLLYNKGPLVLHALRQELGKSYGEEKGDQVFFTLLRSFVTNFQFKWGATRHLIGILNQITGQNWQPWFERYVFGTETPKVKL